MPRDYKIGIIIGLLVVIAGVVYFIVTSGEQPPQPAPEPAMQERQDEIVIRDTPGEMPPETTPTRVVVEEVPARDETLVVVDDEPAAGTAEDVSIGYGDPLTETERGLSSGLTNDTPADESAFSDTPVGVDIASVELDADADRILTQDDPSPAPMEPIRETATRTPSYLDPPPSQPVTPRETATRTPSYLQPSTTDVIPPVTPVTTGRTGTYVVTEADTTGFWGISKKYYGSFKYVELIQNANPNVNSRALRPGRTLVMPPKPVETTTASRSSDASRQGQFSTNAAGQRIYTVSDSDSAGLWGIATKAYGKGHLYPLIAKANPDVDTTKLNAGDVLVIPPAPTESPVSASVGSAIRAAEARHGQTIMENGKRYYIMAGGDHGFWTVSKKVYGDGKYMNIIADANPGVNSDTLQPGDKLLAPPLPPQTQRRTRTTTPSTGGVVAEPVGGGSPEPYFD